MNNCELIDAIALRMLEHDAGSPRRAQHSVKVHRFAQLIGRAEGLEPQQQLVLECAALVHDIAIGPCTAKYGHCTADMQQREGPAYARELLAGFGLEPQVLERVCYLVAHHHTYTDIDGLDYRILVEADFLVNLHEQQAERAAIEQACAREFRTRTGTRLYQLMFGLNNPYQNARQ